MARRDKPSVEDMDDNIQHSYDHRGDTGKYANIYKEEIVLWRPDVGEHEFCIIPFLCKENSVFRKKNPDFNRPFDDEKIQNQAAWTHKLTVLIHSNVGVNKDAVMCLRTLKEECPICEERDKLFELIDQETDKDKAEKLQERADRLGPAKKALYNVLIFDSSKEMKKGVQIWEAPHASMEDVLSELYTNKRTGEKKYFTIPEQGWNVCFERKGKGLSTEYRGVVIEKRRVEDELSDSDLSELYSMVYNLDEIVEIRDYQTIRTMQRGMEEALTETSEEKSEQESRFRGRERKEETDSSREKVPEEESEVGVKVPEKYAECFGVMNNQRAECEDCPKNLWEACLARTEENKTSAKQEPHRKFRRGLE